MKIISTYFEVNNANIYTRLKNVFKYSLQKNSPDIKIEIIKIPPFPIEEKRFQAQMVKQRWWTDFALQQTENYIMMDCDFLILKDLSDVFNSENFDIGYTVHNQKIKPFNGGMIFCQPTENTNKFWKLWLEMCENMYINPFLRKMHNHKYKGFAQIALGVILETIQNTIPGIIIKKFPCSEYNACDEEWDTIEENVRAIHIKGRMRKALFQGTKIYSQKIFDLWKQYEQEYNSSNPQC